jgi:hypothetical protein
MTEKYAQQDQLLLDVMPESLHGGIATNLFVLNMPRLSVDIEVNMVGGGVIDDSGNKLPLCQSAQEQFDAFCAIKVVPLAQLHEGAIIGLGIIEAMFQQWEKTIK